MVFQSLRRSVRARLEQVADQSETLLERLARAEVDEAVHAKLKDILVPLAVVTALLLAAQFIGQWISDVEARRITVTSIVLVAWTYGFWTVLGGIWAARPLIAVWGATRLSPLALARLLLYQRILAMLRDTFTTAEGRTSSLGHAALGALRFIDRPPSWEAYAFRLADRLAPVLLRHAGWRALTIVTPIVVTWAAYRLIIFPELVRAGSGLGPWEAFVYPLAVLIDIVFGTSLHQQMLR